jgi:hypothetical protein
MTVIEHKRRVCDRCGRSATSDDVGFSCLWPCKGTVIEREYVEMPAEQWRGAVEALREVCDQLGGERITQTRAFAAYDAAAKALAAPGGQ